MAQIKNIIIVKLHGELTEEAVEPIGRHGTMTSQYKVVGDIVAVRLSTGVFGEGVRLEVVVDLHYAVPSAEEFPHDALVRFKDSVAMTDGLAVLRAEVHALGQKFGRQIVMGSIQGGEV